MKRLLASSVFFRVIVGLMVFQGLWIALTAKYPMAFDEDFHLGIIKLYSHHLSPFWQAHPSDGDAFGAVTRDPSYFFHYLMSFVLRFLRLFTENETIQIICLRIINVALFTSCLPLFRRLLLRTGASKALVHSCLLFFILIPIVPLLAAHINYDNLFLPLVALSLLLTDSVASRLAKKQLDVTRLVQLLIVCLLTSIVKYAFLPLFFAIVLYLGFRFYKTLGLSAKLWRAAKKDIQHISQLTRVALAVGVIIFGGLFMERVGMNILRYHRPAPDCADVLTIEQCSAYGPWNRDYNLALHKAPDAPRSPAGFTWTWQNGMWFRSYFVLAGPTEDYQTRGPLTVPAQSARLFAVVGGIATVMYGVRVFRRYNGGLLGLLLFSSVIYVLFLWLDEYMLFLHAGKAVAINGRYLLVVALPILLFVGLSCREALRRFPRAVPVVALVVLGCSLWGGGVLTYMIRSQDNWYWPSPAARIVNHAAQKVLVPITPGSRKPTQYLP